MSCKRTLLPIVIRIARSPNHLPRPLFLSPLRIEQRPYPSTRTVPRRCNSQHTHQAPTTKSYTFQDVKALISDPPTNKPSRILIDVREPHELARTGRIPTSHNLPISSSPDGLFLPAEDFEDKFGWSKPSAETEVVFYCKAGVRSRAAAEMARMAGWEKVGEYSGSWDEWVAKGGERVAKGGERQGMNGQAERDG